MATTPQPTKFEYVELGNEPEYYVTETRYEVVGNGNVRRYAYVLRNRELHLIHTEIIPAEALILMGRKAMMIGEESFNEAMFSEDLGSEH